MKQLFSLVFVLFISLSGSLKSYAGPPFGTDDPEPVGFRHWEYYLSSMDQFQPGFSTGTLPHFELNYGLIRGCQIHFELPMNYSVDKNKEFRYGYAFTEIGFKYRFYSSKDESFQVGTFPIFEVPTVKNTNFSNNKLQVYLPLWLQKSFGRFTTYGGGGYWINPGDGNKNWIYAGWEIQSHLGITCSVQNTRLVSECQIWNMVTLGSTMPTRTRRLVCPLYVCRR